MIAALCRALLRLAGWTLDLERRPRVDSYMLIGYPHTSNWDFVLAMLAKGATGLRFRWIGKHSIFRPPFGALMRAMGGIPLDRGNSAGFIDAIASEYARDPKLVIGMMPEGTRKFMPYWRSGFYYIALQAGVPLVMAYIDASQRRIGFGPTLYLSGDTEQDLDKIRDFYRHARGIVAANAANICFRQHQQ